ncbi:MAG: hypothetical protein NXI24_03500 [bacterium]|nr:hypothetical protein [bacterium]
MAPALTLLQKILFTVVFTVYWFIFYGIVYYALSWWDPALLEIPERLGETHVLAATAIFTALVFLAYAGAGYVVLGRLPGGDPDRNSGWSSRRTGGGRRSGPAPGDRLRKSRRFFGSRGDDSSATGKAAKARPPQQRARPAGRRGPADAGRGRPGPARKAPHKSGEAP